jgi:hypothetical protein
MSQGVPLCSTAELTTTPSGAYLKGSTMQRRDEIDAKLAKHFAWSFVPPGETARVAERLRVAEGESDAPRASLAEASDEEAMEEVRAKATDACKPLSVAIEQAWHLKDEDARQRAVKRLLARADRLGFELMGLEAWPVEAVRFLRLLLRCSAVMTRRQRERALRVASFVPLDHPEAADLLVEIARAGDRDMAAAIFSEDEWVPEVGDEEALVARLADVIDEGPAHPSRVAAIELVGRFEAREGAIAALRRALRLPSFAVRARALHTLATAQPCAVTSEDLVLVLRDLVAHAPPDALVEEEHEENERMFAVAVLEALRHVHPDDAAEALLDWIDAEYDALWLDAGWATEALAVAFPETASAMVDHWLACTHAYQRTKALAALSRLPDAMSLPRLRLAASDPAPSVREAARRHWLERFGQPCPVGVEGLLGARLLDRPPSDRFHASLAVMQGRVAEARQAMSRALLAQAPDREALVLLLQHVGDDAESGEPLPSHKEGGLAAAIVERFGALGVEGLCEVAQRFPEPESFGWMRRLGDLVERGVIARDQTGPLRALASKHVSSDDAGQLDDSLRLLELVGAPCELFERVLALGLDDDVGAWEARKLIVAWPDRTIDARLASEMALALADRNWLRLQNAAWMALGRGAPAACVIAQRVLEVAANDEAAAEAAVECARGLRALGRLEDAWALAALARPESALFAVVARAWRKSSVIRGALEEALASPARGGASAAEAAVALLDGEPPLAPRDRRLPAVLAGAPPPQRAALVFAMCVRGAPFSLVAPHLEGLLTSSDACVTSALVGVALWLKTPKAHALLRAVLPRVVDAELRADIEEELGEAVAPFWAEG